MSNADIVDAMCKNCGYRNGHMSNAGDALEDRKVFACKRCGALYEEKVTECDCAVNVPFEFIEGVATFGNTRQAPEARSDLENLACRVSRIEGRLGMFELPQSKEADNE